MFFLGKMNKIIILSLLCLSGFAKAEVLASSSEGICYLPTQSNVAYSELVKLAVDSPAKVLAYGEQPYQFGELWLPAVYPTDAVAKYRNPLVILVHGGCWLNAFDIQHTHALSTALAQAGYAVWSIEYRRTGDKGGGWPGSYEDIKLAIEYLPKLEEYPIDLDLVAIAGHSAGGHLALLAGIDKLYDFRAVIGLAAIVDLEQYSLGTNSCQVATPAFMGGSAQERPQVYRQANPARHRLHDSTVLLHGTKDSIVPTEHATRQNVRSRLIQGAGHFDMVHPGTQSYQTLLQELAQAFADKRSS